MGGKKYDLLITEKTSPSRVLENCVTTLIKQQRTPELLGVINLDNRRREGYVKIASCSFEKKRKRSSRLQILWALSEMKKNFKTLSSTGLPREGI